MSDGADSLPRPRPLLAGLVGRGIAASRSPGMHEAEGARLGLHYAYRRFDFDELGLEDADLPLLIGRLRAEGYAGLNVTHPFKERVIDCLDELSTDAKAIGAVNTVVFRDHRSTGHNTDSWGFGESFGRGLAAPALNHVVVIGAGGAGLAVAHALLGLGADRIAVIDIDRAKAIRLADRAGSRFGTDRAIPVEDLEAELTRADGLVNASPVGMDKYPGMPVDERLLRPELWVADVVYFPSETELIRTARRRGCQVLTGSGMAVFQAVKAFELITGVVPDRERMSAHFESA